MEYGFIDAVAYNTDERGRDTTKNNYYDNWGLQHYTNAERSTSVLYFIFTTLTTIGFGDFYPISNLERVLMVFVFMIGVAVFALVMGNFLDSVKALKKI